MKRFMNGFVFVLVVGGQLYAQPTSPTPAGAGTGKSLSEADMAKHGVDLQLQVRDDLEHVQQVQAVARQDKDVIKYSCVNDKFIKLKAEANIFDLAHTDFTASIATSARFKLFDSVSSAANRVHKVREEADGCAGEPELNSRESGNSFLSPDIIDDPTTSNPLGQGNIVEPPNYASPYS